MLNLTRWVSTLAALALLVCLGTGCTARVKTSYHLKRADRYFDSGQYQLAEIEYENVLHYDPQNVKACGRLGLVYFYEGRAPEAMPILLQAEQLDPGNLDVRMKLGAAYLGFGKFDKALIEAEFVLSQKPQDEQAPLLLAAAATTNEFDTVRLHLQQLQQPGDHAPLEVALGTLALRQNDLKTAGGCFQRAITLDPKFSDAYTARGSFYWAQKDLKQADMDFQTAAELASPWSGNGVRYAQFKVLTGDPVAGEKLLQDIVEKTPSYLPAWMALAQLSAAENNYTNALSFLGNVLSRDPQNFEALLLQGRLQLLQGQLDQAIINYKQMAAIYPQAPVVHFALAQAYLANNQTNEADLSLTKALDLKPDYTDAILLRAENQIFHGDPAAAIVSLRKVVQQQPQIAQAWLLLASAYHAEGTPESAVEIYRELERSYPESPQVPTLLGRLYFQLDQRTDARTQYEKALHLQPGYLPAVEQLVDLDLVQGQYTAALEQVQQLIVRNPNESVLQLLLGTTFSAQGETNQAEMALSKAIKLQPDSQAAYLLLAQLYTQTGQTRKALDNLQFALDKDPNDIAALMIMGIIYNSENDYENARDAYERLLAIAPDNGMALNNLACVYADHLGQLDKAYPLAQRARDVAPADPSVADTLGWILYRRGEFTPALVLLRESADKLYATPEVQFHLGMACYMAGYETEATAELQHALQLPDDFPEKDTCRQRLAILDIHPQKAGNDTRVWLEKWTADHPDDPVALARLGAIYQYRGMPEKALATYTAILNSNPQNIFALVNLAQLYASTNPQTAYTFAKSACELMPNNPEITHLAGHLAFVTGNYPQALTWLELSAQVQPQNPEVQFDLGQALYSEGKVQDARAAMQNALQTGTAFANRNAALRFLALTAAVDVPAQALAEENLAGQILNSTPDDVPALMIKAAIAGQKADAVTAQQIYVHVLNVYPDFAPAQKKLAILVCRQGDYARAADLLQKSSRQLTQDPELLYYLGLTQYHLNNSAESKAALQQALDLGLAGGDATDARRILAELK